MRLSDENSSLARVLDELAAPPEQEAISMSDELSAGARTLARKDKKNTVSVIASAVKASRTGCVR